MENEKRDHPLIERLALALALVIGVAGGATLLLGVWALAQVVFHI